MISPINSKLICINKCKNYTIGKTYDSLIYGHQYLIYGDDLNPTWWHEPIDYYFKTISEIRENKLNDLGI